MTIDYLKLAEAVVDGVHTFLLDYGMRPALTAPQKAEMSTHLAQLMEKHVLDDGLRPLIPPLSPPEVPPGGMH